MKEREETQQMVKLPSEKMELVEQEDKAFTISYDLCWERNVKA